MFWTFLVVVCSLALVACIIFYFYYVFSSAVFSRVMQENPKEMPWPTTIVCDRQIFSQSKMNKVNLMSSTHASLLTYSIDPLLSRPDVMNNSRVGQVTQDLTTIIGRYSSGSVGSSSFGAYVGTSAQAGNTQMDNLFKEIAPNCTQLILQCTFGNTTITGWDCCANIFDPTPYFTAYGTCYSTRQAKIRQMVRVAGDANSFTVVTMHDTSSPFDSQFLSPRLAGAQGLAFAVVDDNSTVQAAMAQQSQTVMPNNYASVSLARSVIDNRDLEWSAISPLGCVTPGIRKSSWVDADLLYGIDYRYGYSRDACSTTKNQEMIVRELFLCTFNPLNGDNMQRCNANQSVSYYRSFIDPNATATPEIQIISVNQKPEIMRRLNKICVPDCYLDSFSMTSSFFTMPQTQTQTLASYVLQSGQSIQGSNVQTVVLKLSMSSLEYQRIYNFPMPGIQFIAEIGGLLAFFLGMSILSVIECCCYCCCCGCRNNDSNEE